MEEKLKEQGVDKESDELLALLQQSVVNEDE
jgi:hypothetical protein